MTRLIGTEVFRFAPLPGTCCFPPCSLTMYEGACIFAHPASEWEIDFGVGGWTEGGGCAPGDCESIQGIFTLDAWDLYPTAVTCAVDYNPAGPFCFPLSSLSLGLWLGVFGPYFTVWLAFDGGNAQIVWNGPPFQPCGICPSPVTLTKSMEFGIPCNGSLPNTITATRIV